MLCTVVSTYYQNVMNGRTFSDQSWHGNDRNISPTLSQKGLGFRRPIFLYLN